jgi:nitrogen fixation NifU-like protein
MNSELEELYQEIILDHSRRPRNFGELEDATVRVHGDNPACGDEIHLSAQFGPKGELQEIKFTGHGCAISQASASLMTTKLKGRTRAEAKTLVGVFHDLVMGEDDQPSPSLGDLQVMRGVRKFPQRVKCAMLPWRALEQALRQGAGESIVSTETDSLTLIKGIPIKEGIR